MLIPKFGLDLANRVAMARTRERMVVTIVAGGAHARPCTSVGVEECDVTGRGWAKGLQKKTYNLCSGRLGLWAAPLAKKKVRLRRAPISVQLRFPMPALQQRGHWHVTGQIKGRRIKAQPMAGRRGGMPSQLKRPKLIAFDLDATLW